MSCPLDTSPPGPLALSAVWILTPFFLAVHPLHTLHFSPRVGRQVDLAPMKRGSVGGLESLDPNLQFGRPMPGSQKTDLDAQVSPVSLSLLLPRLQKPSPHATCVLSGGSGTGGRCWRITGRKGLSATTTISTGRGRARTAAATRGKKKGVRGGGEAGWRCNACVLWTHLLMSTSGWFLQNDDEWVSPDSNCLPKRSRRFCGAIVETLWSNCGDI